ncbi:MAG: DUF2085 domain-containing protein [Candidatus Thermoplasmatota archaeon]|nr:DUF2085 domain-containing protein [Candidatus Thermoplasmatota archaeon]
MMERQERPSKILIIFFVIFLAWALMQFLTPLSLPSNSISNLTGSVGVLDNENSINKMSFPANFIYSAGDRMCHQKSERSFYLNGNQMPFCSRCTAIWLGLAIGLGFMLFYKIDLDERFLFVILIGLVPIGIDGIGQHLGFWESTNIIRLVTGLLAGGVSGIAIGLITGEIEVNTYPD